MLGQNKNNWTLKQWLLELIIIMIIASDSKVPTIGWPFLVKETWSNTCPLIDWKKKRRTYVSSFNLLTDTCSTDQPMGFALFQTNIFFFLSRALLQVFNYSMFIIWSKKIQFLVQNYFKSNNKSFFLYKY